MRETTITLAGKAYVVARMPAMRAIAWRKVAQKLLDSFPAIETMYQRDSQSLVQAAADLYRASNGMIEQLIEVVLAADPQLAADRDLILSGAYEEEFMEAFQSAMILNAPLSELARSQAAPNGASMPTI